MSFELVVVDGERRIDSRIVAEGIAVQHDNLMQTVRKYRPGLEKYGILLFETGKIKRRGRPEQYALLNKEQFGYLLMFVRVTQTVRAYREEVYEKFLAYERLQQARQEPALPTINSLWEQRLSLFSQHTRIPAGYWCIFLVMAAYCRVREITGEYLMEGAQPDVSVGQHWLKYAREVLHLDMSEVKTYPHHYPDQRGMQDANIYPNAWLGLFHDWFQRIYIPYLWPGYLKTHRRAIGESQRAALPRR